MFKDQTTSTTPSPVGEITKAQRRQAKRAEFKAAPAKPLPLDQGQPPAEARPAARFMKTGGQPKPAGQQPAYKLRQKLADLDLQLQHPHLDKDWRRKIASPRAEQVPVIRGRQGAAKKDIGQQ